MEPTTANKRPYESPTAIVLGPLDELTLAGVALGCYDDKYGDNSQRGDTASGHLPGCEPPPP